MTLNYQFGKRIMKPEGRSTLDLVENKMVEKAVTDLKEQIVERWQKKREESWRKFLQQWKFGHFKKKIAPKQMPTRGQFGQMEPIVKFLNT